MSKKRAIVTIINSVNPTVMEFNEFVLYRARNFPGEEHYFIALGPAQSHFVQECKSQGAKYNVEAFECGGRYLKLRSVLNQILAKLKKEKMPVVVHISQPRSAVAAQFLNLLFLRKVPTIFTVHSMFDLYVLPTKVLTIIACILAGSITCVSQSSYDIFPSFMKWLKRKNICIVVNGVDVERIDRIIVNGSDTDVATHDQHNVSGPNDTFRLLNVGRLIPAKNQARLVEMLAQLSTNVTLTIIGDGPLRGKLETLADRLGVTHRLRLTGIISREEVFEEMLRADLFVSSSVREGLPVAVLEAMAARMPVVLSDIGPHREISQWGSSVKIMPIDIKRWAELIRSFISMSPQARKSIGRQNRDIVERHFSLARMHAEYTQLYEMLWNQSRLG
jgi:glycosyltransferase involved in cell wall biosynthesis